MMNDESFWGWRKEKQNMPPFLCRKLWSQNYGSEQGRRIFVEMNTAGTQNLEAI
jgi:hypothetical protein